MLGYKMIECDNNYGHFMSLPLAQINEYKTRFPNHSYTYVEHLAVIKQTQLLATWTIQENWERLNKWLLSLFKIFLAASLAHDQNSRSFCHTLVEKRQDNCFPVFDDKRIFFYDSTSGNDKICLADFLFFYDMLSLRLKEFYSFIFKSAVMWIKIDGDF